MLFFILWQLLLIEIRKSLELFHVLFYSTLHLSLMAFGRNLLIPDTFFLSSFGFLTLERGCTSSPLIFFLAVSNSYFWRESSNLPCSSFFLGNFGLLHSRRAFNSPLTPKVPCVKIAKTAKTDSFLFQAL